VTCQCLPAASPKNSNKPRAFFIMPCLFAKKYLIKKEGIVMPIERIENRSEQIGYGQRVKASAMLVAGVASIAVAHSVSAEASAYESNNQIEITGEDTHKSIGGLTLSDEYNKADNSEDQEVQKKRCQRQLELDPVQYSSCQYPGAYVALSKKNPRWVTKHNLSAPGEEDKTDRRKALAKTKPKLYAELTEPVDPSGSTCEDKAKYYEAKGVFSGRVPSNPCGSVPEIGLSMQSIEDASKYFGVNPIGPMRMVACESGFNPNAKDYATGTHRGLFQIGTTEFVNWSAESREYVLRNSKRNLNITSDVFDPKTNAWVGVYKVSRGGGTATPWLASVKCWGGFRPYLSGQYRSLSTWK
jgi:hypothetical protein